MNFANVGPQNDVVGARKIDHLETESLKAEVVQLAEERHAVIHPREPVDFVIMMLWKVASLSWRRDPGSPSFAVSWCKGC